MNTHHKQGFTLIEVALAVAIIGVILSAVLELHSITQHQKRERITNERMHDITEALSTYVENASRLPCPSDPASPDHSFTPVLNGAVLGWERGITYNETRLNSALPTGECATIANNAASLAEAEGIIPFTTLGLPHETALDGWGHYFTYAVSPIFTQITDQSGTGTDIDTGDVHALCRTPRWISNNDNANGPKAKYCCALNGNTTTIFTPATDIIMRLTTDITNTPLTDIREITNYANLAQRPPIAPPFEHSLPLSIRDDIDTPAMVLISHGRNGEGAYLVNGTDDRRRFLGSTGDNANERNNTNNNREYFIGQTHQGAGADYFDDIVMWFTQNGLMAYNGTSSCSFP